jgi:TonB family protein
VTPLVAPPPSHPLTLPELMAQNKPQPKGAPTPAPKPTLPKFVAPAPRQAAPAPALISEPPPALPNNTPPVPQENIFARTTPAPAPPVIQATEQQPKATPQEQPKLAFETPSGQVAAGKAPGGKIPIPTRATVDELGRAMARPSSGGGLTVGDTIDSGAAGGLSSPSAPVRNQSAVQMLTDTMGVDFKPYLVTVLASVRRNWLAILPESARMGRKGRVQVQFAISRDGSVPKLVISAGSGAEALDRAAVAGISASNPFPPLPSEFQGPQIRLQFTFAYNMQ